MIRLNKFMASCGVASRRKCDQLIADGQVMVNGKVQLEIGCKIDEKRDKVMVCGKDITLPKLYYIKMNKPKGYICSSSDEKGRKIILDLLPENLKDVRLFSIGRLDWDSEGLILLTNDGDFAQKVAHPSGEKRKTYIVTCEGEILESELAVMRKGVVLEDKTRMPGAKITLLGKNSKLSRMEVVISEGQNRQIRRMFEAIGKNIVLLKRVAIGEVKLGGLVRGQCKDMTQNEIASLL